MNIVQVCWHKQALLEAMADRIIESATATPPERAGWAIFGAMYYVLGHTIEEQAQREQGDWAQRGAAMPDHELHRIMHGVVEADPEERFGYGLELILDGLRLRLQEARS